VSLRSYGLAAVAGASAGVAAVGATAALAVVVIERFGPRPPLPVTRFPDGALLACSRRPGCTLFQGHPGECVGPKWRDAGRFH
jgi:hypothetical protein